MENYAFVAGAFCLFMVEINLRTPSKLILCGSGLFVKQNKTYDVTIGCG